MTSPTQVSIAITGHTQADLSAALEEVQRLLEDGCTSGLGRNETSSFTFETTT